MIKLRLIIIYLEGIRRKEHMNRSVLLLRMVLFLFFKYFCYLSEVLAFMQQDPAYSDTRSAQKECFFTFQWSAENPAKIEIISKHGLE